MFFAAAGQQRNNSYSQLMVLVSNPDLNAEQVIKVTCDM